MVLVSVCAVVTWSVSSGISFLIPVLTNKCHELISGGEKVKLFIKTVENELFKRSGCLCSRSRKLRLLMLFRFRDIYEVCLVSVPSCRCRDLRWSLLWTCWTFEGASSSFKPFGSLSLGLKGLVSLFTLELSDSFTWFWNTSGSVRATSCFCFFFKSHISFNDPVLGPHLISLLLTIIMDESWYSKTLNY